MGDKNWKHKMDNKEEILIKYDLWEKGFLRISKYISKDLQDDQWRVLL